MRLLIRQRSRRTGLRLPQFPRAAIEKILIYAQNLSSLHTDKPEEQLRNLRDRAFLLTLADTGLRVHEACNLRRGDLDWNEQRAIIIGKGDREAVVRFSKRSMRAVKDYLGARQNLDGKTGKAITALPIFARHDKGSGTKIKPITTATGRNIVNQRVGESLGNDSIGTITPHSFRHPFEKLVEALGVARDGSRNPLFQIAFAMREPDPDGLCLQGAKVRPAETGIDHAKFDLTATVCASTDGADVLRIAPTGSSG